MHAFLAVMRVIESSSRFGRLLADARVTDRTREIHGWVSKPRHHLHIYNLPVETIKQRVQTAREFERSFPVFGPGAREGLQIGQIRSILQNYLHLTFRPGTQRPDWFI